MRRSISLTALASFIALSTQGAFAATSHPGAAPLVAHSGPAARRAASTISVSRTAPVRVRHAPRIHGTVATSSTDASREIDVLEEQHRVRVLFPALSGDGGS